MMMPMKPGGMPPPGGPGGPSGAPAGGPPPGGPGGPGNPVIEALKILQQFAQVQQQKGNPAIAQWLQEGIQLMSGGGTDEEGAGDLPGGKPPSPPAPGKSAPMPEHAARGATPVM